MKEVNPKETTRAYADGWCPRSPFPRLIAARNLRYKKIFVNLQMDK